jgi:hypothetical protein
MTYQTGKRHRAAASRSSGTQLTSEIATTLDGRDITRPLVIGLQQPRDPRLLGSVDWGVYDRILQDDQVFSTFQQRRLAVVNHTWSVVPGDENDPRSVDAAAKFSETLIRVGWDRVTDKMLFAIFNGYAVAELCWKERDGLFDIDKIKVRHARRFRYDAENRLRLLTPGNSHGDLMPDRKFWVFKAGGSDDDEPYGRGLAEWLYWPVLFKRNGIRFWNIFLDKFGSPTAVGKYRPGTPKSEQQRLLAALQALATDSGITVPEGMDVFFLEAARSGTASYEQLCRMMDEAIAKIVLSQTMTTQDGSSRSQAEVHQGVKFEVVKSDADLQCESFNEDVPRWWTNYNYGADVAPPIVSRVVEQEADTKAQADTDEVLDRLGWVRTEESFRDVYGDGYQRKKPVTGAADPGDGGRVDTDDPDNDDGGADDAADPNGNDRKASFAAGDPRSLYVYRPLLNAAELIAWAREQGFRSTVPAEDMHATVTYSKQPVNWLKMGGFWGWGPDTSDHLVPMGGPRLVEPIGEQGAVALHFFSGHLEARNREMRNAGASWDFPDYMPHVTLTYDAGDVDLSKVTPYRGELRFGPEIFEPIREDWEKGIREASFAEGLVPDAEADRLVDDLIARDGYRATRALTAPMLDAIRAAKSPDELIAALNEGMGDEAMIAADLERAGLAAALDAGEAADA